MIIRCLVACQLLLAGLLLAPAPAADAATITLDGVSVRLRDGTRQVVTVNHTSGTYARVTLWRKKDGHWSRDRARHRPHRVRRPGRRRPP